MILVPNREAIAEARRAEESAAAETEAPEGTPKEAAAKPAESSEGD